MLAAGHRNLCVVGDSDQSIYAWRGADIRNILEFQRDYPDARVVVLDRNYRSTQTILDAANAVIAHNLGRQPKHLWTDLGKGDPVTVYRAQDEHDEAAYIAEEVGVLGDAGIPPSGIAVFYRTHAQTRVLEEVLVRYGVPYQVIGGPRFYERREVKDVLAYLRAVANPADEVALKRIINVPKRGIGSTTVGHLERAAEAEGGGFFAALAAAGDNPRLEARARRQIADFLSVLEHLGTAAEEGPRAALQAVLTDTGYEAELKAEGTLEALSRVENLRELLSVASEFEESGPLGGTGDEDWADLGGRRRLELFLESLSLAADVDSLDEEAGPADPDDAAQRQGPGVPRHLHRRHGGGGLPPHALPGRRRRTGGGAPPGLRRLHPGAAAAVPDPGRAAQSVGGAQLQLAQPLPAGDPRARWWPKRRSASAGRASRRPSPGPPSRPVRSSWATGCGTAPGGRARWCR